MGIQETKQRPLVSALLINAVRIAIITGIAVGAHFLIRWVEDEAANLPEGSQGLLLGGVLFLVVLAYTVLIAIPFVPGIEVGISLMMIRGAEIAPVVYLATVLGLLTAFLAGRFMSYDWLHQLFLDLRLRRAGQFLERTKILNRQQRVEMLREGLPKWLGRFVVNFRYVTLALIINLPGNSLIGGGGGICLLAGLSRLFSPWVVSLTIALAVSPVPILVWIFGTGILGGK